jgi:type IV fimbrial biogenesis protein FimT
MVKSSMRFLNRGLTLIELMVTLAVTAVVLGAGIPNAARLIASNQLTASTNDLVRHMHLARSEAVKRGDPVSVCASFDGEVCANTHEWGAGWIVFTDNSGNSGSLDGNDEIIRVYTPIGTTISIQADQDYVRYMPDGSMSL